MTLASASNSVAQVDESPQAIYKQYCEQPGDLRDELISQAQKDVFNVRHVEFLGAEHVRARELFKRVWMVNEGDIFTRENLEKALKHLSGFGKIYPVTMDGVTVKIDERDKTIDILYCVKERKNK